MRVVQPHGPGEHVPQMNLRPAVLVRLDERLRDPAVDAVRHRGHRARQKIRGQPAEAVGDGMRSIPRTERHGFGQADRLTVPADVDHHVVADIDAPGVRQSDQIRQRRAVDLLRWIEREEQPPAGVKISGDRRNLRHGKV